MLHIEGCLRIKKKEIKACARTTTLTSTLDFSGAARKAFNPRAMGTDSVSAAEPTSAICVATSVDSFADSFVDSCTRGACILLRAMVSLSEADDNDESVATARPFLLLAPTPISTLRGATVATLDASDTTAPEDGSSLDGCRASTASTSRRAHRPSSNSCTSSYDRKRPAPNGPPPLQTEVL